MKKNKRCLTLGLIIAMVLGTTACGSMPAEDPTPVETVETEATVDFSDIQDLGDMLSDAGMEGDPNAPVKKGYVEGSVSESEYISRYVGLKYTNPEGYYMIIDELSSMNELFSGLVSNATGTGTTNNSFANVTGMKYEMVSVEETKGEAMALVMSIQVEEDQGNDLETQMQVSMQEQGYSSVTMWGREWFYAEQTQTAGNSSIAQEMYMSVVPGAIYTVMFTYPSGDVEKKEAMLNSFEQIEATAAPKETIETEVSEETSEQE